jgi:hypothetical protein
VELIFKNETVQFDKQVSVEEIIEKIDKLLANRYYYSHLIVDGEEIYENLESYLLESLGSISTIEVAVKTVREFINEVLLMASNYLTDGIPKMTVLANQFYQNPSADNWLDFSSMLEGMQWLNQTIDLIDKAKERPGNWNECIQLAVQLQLELKNLEEAIENTDHVLIADIIQYELLPIYEALQTEFNTTIDTEVERHDIN